MSDTARLMVDAPSFAIGWQQPIYVASPPAGQEWSHQVDGRFYERLLAVRYTLTTSAVVANRVPQLVLKDANGVVLFAVPAAGAVVASSAITVNLAYRLGTLSAGIAGNTYGTLPDLLLPPGYSWSVVTAGLDVGDTETGVTLLVQQFPNDAASISAIG